jgi:hypothetical protein
MKLLTAEQVLHEVDLYCTTKGNPVLAKVMLEYYRKTGEMAPAVLTSLNLEPVVMYREKP